MMLSPQGLLLTTAYKRLQNSQESRKTLGFTGSRQCHNPDPHFNLESQSKMSTCNINPTFRIRIPIHNLHFEAHSAISNVNSFVPSRVSIQTQSKTAIPTLHPKLQFEHSIQKLQFEHSIRNFNPDTQSKM